MAGLLPGFTKGVSMMWIWVVCAEAQGCGAEYRRGKAYKHRRFGLCGAEEKERLFGG
jgi:hypothetical protein